MCWSSKPKGIEIPAAPAVSAPPTPAPLPSPSPTATESAITADQRRNRIAALRQGLLSTIKTSPKGLVGALASDEPGKKVLGA